MNNKFVCVKSLTEDFGNLFYNAEHSDFVLKCSKKSIFVQKVVLAARSDFFSGMLSSNKKECKESTGKNKDVDPDILKLVLRYMYTGEFSQLSMETIHKVYTAADKFGMKPLKVKCYLLFSNNCLTGDEENFVEGNEELENTEQSVVAKNALRRVKGKELLRNMFISSEWKAFSHEFPHKAQEMCRPLLLQK